MPFFTYASFPNSRNRFRSPTISAHTQQFTLNAVGGIPIILSSANQNRTSLTVENESLTEDMVYGYTVDGTQNPTVTATFGLTNDLFFRTTTNTLYIKNDDGTTTNWSVTTLDVVGFIIKPLQAFQVDALQTVRALSFTAFTVLVSVDEGRG